MKTDKNLQMFLCAAASLMLLTNRSACAQQTAVAAPSFMPAVASAAVILARYKAAVGGAAWDSVRTTHTVSSEEIKGVTGTEDEWDDAVTGRTESSDSLLGIHEYSGYDGTRSWEKSDSGVVKIDDSASDRQDAINNAYSTSSSYWYSNRLPGKAMSLGQFIGTDGVIYDVVRIEPKGGTATQMWFDHATGLLAKVIDPSGGTTSTAFFSDYRTLSSGIKVPYTTVQHDDGDPNDTTYHVTSLEINAAPPPGIYDIPGQSAQGYVFAGNARSVTVPFQYIDNLIHVPIRINGQMETAVFDTGASFIVSTKLAAALKMTPQGSFQVGGYGAGLVSTGVAHADTVEIGGLTIIKPVFRTVDVNIREFDQPFIGSDLLNTFVIEVNYADHTMTLTEPDSFRYHGSGKSMPFTLSEIANTPVVKGALDGIPGTFSIDTGCFASLLINQPFTQTNQLIAKYKPKFSTIAGFGIGGKMTASVARTGTLTLGGVSVHDRITYFLDNSSSKATKTGDSGNVGNPVLSEFNVIFDYPKSQLILERNKNYGAPDTYCRSGIVFDPDWDSALVSDVVPGSPATDAGIAPGDSVTSVNGVVPGATGFHQEIRELYFGAAGSNVVIQFKDAQNKIHTATLVLRDLI